MDAPPTHCRFEHPGFVALGRPTFRLTRDDKVAALALDIENADVVIPLRSLARLFSIRSDSPDGQMLDLVERGLRFVPSLRIGEQLPSEVLTGEASWDPGQYHRQVASARLQLQLVHWISGLAAPDEARVTSQMLLVSVDDPAIRPRVQQALRQAATELALEGGGPAVAALLEQLAGELAYIESLRERLLRRVGRMATRLGRAGPEQSNLAQGRRETLVQVLRLVASALAELTQSFETIDGQTIDILSALGDLELKRRSLRPSRNRLYCELLAWDPLLTAWDHASTIQGKEQEGFWRLVDDTYRFLAARYMPVQEWQPVALAPTRSERGRAALIW